ncbi:hypothetical protein [Winogradskyella sp.]|uniref:hypothetical protein n=1 Tax=Winogradskyella sp. TaxID=1883156 RepID=UPI003BA8AF68
MKKYSFLLVLLTLVLNACSLDDGAAPSFSLEVMPITNVDMPDQFVHGETYAIDVSYVKPTSCYAFNDFLYEIEGNERTIAVVNTVYADGNANCTGNAGEVTVSFDFTVTSTDTYVFKFFQGEDHTTGLDQYHIVEVPVSTGRSLGNTQN